MFDSTNHVHICQVSPLLSCGDTCQIKMCYHTYAKCFDNYEKLRKRLRIVENWLIKPHPRTTYIC